ncbi:5-dehydro-2-deoxygluconokinase [Ktedonosporobacter rubrisoli]|uniref:5-dehydro-2-deoxygluconokinase n=1 Tax=Ktedonosporobacter rubrisoli TaxID=2509675 RepID=A0A4P6JU87_KTERU|nr:5-dehydro-2-deoxygluconokinase [Ktedonosporobacter rubrisoli]QBD78852.1 5-dehydro-2-deoxygluconokinase [Ktedonosporobacter rubrisoli]
MGTPVAYTLGRIIVDLYANDIGVPLRQVKTFQKYLGGSAANVSVGMARLGLQCGLISRVGADDFGRYLRERLAEEGVDHHMVITDKQNPTGLAFAALFPPADSEVLFYRKPCADIHLSLADLDFAALRQARLLEVACTSLCASPSREATLAALEEHRASGGLNVLDIDWRPSLWPSVEEARVCYHSALRLADIVLANESELAFAGNSTDPETAARHLLGFGVKEVVAKRGAAGCLSFTAGEVVKTSAFRTEVMNTLGAGDGFAAAYCYGLLNNWDTRQRLQFANAAGAIVVSRHSCSEAMPTLAEVQQLIATAEA